MKKLYLIIVIVFAIIYLPGCSGKNNGENNTKSGNSKKGVIGKSGSKKSGKDETDTIPVSVKTPSRGDINSFLLFSSNIDTEKMVDIYPMTSGIIEKINFDEGDKVSKGTVLAVLDDREASINEQKAKITYRQQKMEFERQKEIYEKELISREEYEKLKYNLELNRLDWEQKKLLLSFTRIKSPISGLVSKRYIKTGNRINTNELAFTVVYTKEKIAIVNIPEQEKDQIFLKQKAIITSGEKLLKGFIKRISPAIDPESGTFKTTIEISDPTNTMVIGQFVNVKIIKKTHKNVILVTKDVLLYEEGRVFVFKVTEGNIAKKVEIEIGFDDGKVVEVIKGVSTGEKLVSAGKGTLKNNAKVKLVKSLI